MSNVNFSICCTCGYEFRTGTDGSHSCSSELSKDNKKLVEQNKALRAALEKVRTECYEGVSPVKSNNLQSIVNKCFQEVKALEQAQ